jgi:hypothetical protein
MLMCVYVCVCMCMHVYVCLQLRECERCRNLGNTAYKTGEYDDATRHYRAAVQQLDKVTSTSEAEETAVQEQRVCM